MSLPRQLGHNPGLREDADGQGDEHSEERARKRQFRERVWELFLDPSSIPSLVPTGLHTLTTGVLQPVLDYLDGVSLLRAARVCRYPTQKSSVCPLLVVHVRTSSNLSFPKCIFCFSQLCLFFLTSLTLLFLFSSLCPLSFQLPSLSLCSLIAVPSLPISLLSFSPPST